MSLHFSTLKNEQIKNNYVFVVGPYVPGRNDGTLIIIIMFLLQPSALG
jgi:hypothetical protein